MKKIATLGILFFAIHACQYAEPPSDTTLSTEDEQVIRSNIQFANIDPIDEPEEFFVYFTEDVHWNYRGTVAEGMEGLRAFGWCHTISGENTVRQIEGSGDMAYALGTYRLSLNCEDVEDPVNSEGEFITIHERGPDNSWRIAVYLAP